jgi:2-keto-4-pentenoate hydratase/2-oxohepta-3-ene-1,7-dioic acid hydratase in catechol pathway
MRLVTTDRGPGVLSADGSVVHLLDTAAKDLGGLLRAGLSIDEIADLPERDRQPSDNLRMLPVVRPFNVWAQGGGYRGHLPIGADLPLQPRWFLIAPSSLIGCDSPVVLPGEAPDEVDYEGEVALVVGRTMRDVSREKVWEHIAGITLLNDISARDVQRGRHPSGPDIENVALAKSFDSFTPIGPALATLDSFDDVNDIPLTTCVDGEIRQKGSTAELIFPVPELIEFLSARITLRPGDVITTGSPIGVGEPTGAYLRAGSEVTISSPSIGTLRNRVVAEGGPADGH